MKATQVGVSTWAIRLALFHADVAQRTVLYAFPSDRDLSDFSRHRIRPVIRASEHLMSRMPSDAVDNVGQKQIGTAGWVYFRGTSKPIDSIPADMIVFDEYDDCNQANVEQSERRVTGPLSAGLLRRVGVPSVPGFGIARAFDASDQRIWTVKCGACTAWNPMRGAEAFAANVDQDQLAVVCRKCRRRLDLREGEWVATFPDRDTLGYHLPKLAVPGAPIGQLVENSRKTAPHEREAFYRRDLGEPWVHAEGRLSLEQVRACVHDDLRPKRSLKRGAFVGSERWITMGVDVASSRALNVVIEEMVDAEDSVGRKVFVGEVDDREGRSAFDWLCQLMDDFDVDMACIDHAPEGRFAEAFADRFPGRVYRVGYFNPGTGQRQDVAPWRVDDQARYVSLWRTRALDATLERFRTGRVQLPPLDMLPADYPAHLGAAVRRVEPLPAGTVRVAYVKTGPDDFLHAEAFCLSALELMWRKVGMRVAREQLAAPLQLTEGSSTAALLHEPPSYSDPFA